MSDVKNRKLFKLMENDNQKIRSKARKERNERIRNLVCFVRKRDKRVQSFLDDQKKKVEENRQKVEQIRLQKKLERRKALDETVNAEWTQFENVERELNRIENSLSNNCDDSDNDNSDNLYCIVCLKLFQTMKQFENHVASKKHRRNEQLLTADMIKEENEFGNNTDNNGVEEVQHQVTNDKKKKSAKKAKKVLKVTSEADDSGDDVPITLLPSTKRQAKKQLREDILRTRPTSSTSSTPLIRNSSPKSTQIDDNLVGETCAKCGHVFESKNKLFQHLNATGHSVYLNKNGNDNSKIKSGANCRSKKC